MFSVLNLWVEKPSMTQWTKISSLKCLATTTSGKLPMDNSTQDLRRITLSLVDIICTNMPQQELVFSSQALSGTPTSSREDPGTCARSPWSHGDSLALASAEGSMRTKSQWLCSRWTTTSQLKLREHSWIKTLDILLCSMLTPDNSSTNKLAKVSPENKTCKLFKHILQ